MDIACREWRAKPAAHKTWINLKIDMKVAQLDLGVTTTTDTGGYGANQAEEQDIHDANQTHFANMIEQQNATAATIATLMEAMKQLSDQVKMGSQKKDTENKIKDHLITLYHRQGPPRLVISTT